MIRQIIVKGIPQGWAPYLLIFLSMTFSFEIRYFADDNSLYSCGMNLDNIFTNLLQDT